MLDLCLTITGEEGTEGGKEEMTHGEEGQKGAVNEGVGMETEREMEIYET